MAQGRRVAVREVHIVWETPAGNFDQTDTHWMDRVMNAISAVNNINAWAEIVDENGIQLREGYQNLKLGNPSNEMKRAKDYEFGPEEVVKGA